MSYFCPKCNNILDF